MNDRPGSRLTVGAVDVGDARLLSCHGVLDSSTYVHLRDSVIKAALDEPSVVVVDVNNLEVPTPSAWSVFTSARWHVHTWPNVLIMLVCANISTRNLIARNGVARYVPVHASVRGALGSVAVGGDRGRQRVKVRLPANEASVANAREVVAEWLLGWSRPDLIATAQTVVTALVENVLRHTSSAPVIVAEVSADTVTVAVQDESPTLAVRHEDPRRGTQAISGLSVVAALTRSWGCTPMPSGKTVWAVLGPENRL